MLHNLIQSLSKGSDSHKIGSSNSTTEEEGELFTSLFKDAIHALENGAKSGKSLFTSLFSGMIQKGKNSDAKEPGMPKSDTLLLAEKFINQKKIQNGGDSSLFTRLQAPSQKKLISTDSALKSLIFEAKTALEKSKDPLSNQKMPLAKEEPKDTKTQSRKVSDLFKLAKDQKLKPTAIKVEFEQITQISQKELTKKPAKPFLKHSLESAQKTQKEEEIPTKEPKETLKKAPLSVKSRAVHAMAKDVKTENLKVMAQPTQVTSKEIHKETQRIPVKGKLENLKVTKAFKSQEQNPEPKIAESTGLIAKVKEPKNTKRVSNILKEKVLEPKISQDSPKKSPKIAPQTTKQATQKIYKTPIQTPIAPKKQEAMRAESKTAHNHNQNPITKSIEMPKEAYFTENAEPKTLQTPHNLVGILQLTKKQKGTDTTKESAISLSKKKALKVETLQTRNAKTEESPHIRAKGQKHTPTFFAPKENIMPQSVQSALNMPHEELKNEPFTELLHTFAPNRTKGGQKSKNGEASEQNVKKLENTAPNELKGLFSVANNSKSELALKSARAKETLRNFTATLKDEVQNYKPPLTKLSIELNPENLGSMELTITQRGQGLLVQVLSNPQAIALFMNNNAEFRQQLANAGFNDVLVNFSDGSGGSFGGGFQHSKNQEQEKRNENGLSAYKANALDDMEAENSSLLSQMEIILPKYA